MPLSEQDINIMQDIAILEGKCMESTRCKACPFRAMCLPEFLNPIPPTTQQREKMAVGVLTHHALIDGDISIEEIEEDYKWDKR